MSIPEIIEWLDSFGLELDYQDLLHLAGGFRDLLEMLGPEDLPSPPDLSAVPLTIKRENGYLVFSTSEGENWVRVDSIDRVRSVTHLELDLESGDTLSINLQSTEIESAVYSLTNLMGASDEEH